MAAPTWRLAVGLAKETTWGTAVTATTFYPVKKPSGFVPQYEDIEDTDYRNNASALQAYYEGVGQTPVDTGDMLFFPDDSGHWLMALLGADAISGAGPYTHALTLLNTALPPSYTVVKYDSLIATSRQVAGVRVSEVILKFSTKGKLTIAAKGIGKIAGTIAKPTEAYSAASAYLGWQASATVSAANTKLEEGEIRLTRTLEPIFGANNSQDMTDQMVDVLSVTGSLTFAPVDDTEKAYYTNNTQPNVSIVFTSGTNTLTLQMSKAAFAKGSDIDHGSKYAKFRTPFKAVANATDAGTGNAPFKATLVNGKSAAY